MTNVTDPRGVRTVMWYDEWDRARFVTNAFGTSEAVGTEKRYDANGNVTNLILRNRLTNALSGETRVFVATYDGHRGHVSTVNLVLASRRLW